MNSHTIYEGQLVDDVGDLSKLQAMGRSTSPSS